MRTLRLRISYDGTRYHGWQRQKNDPLTVQEQIEEVLGRILQEQVSLVAASRTDAGVHARGQVAHFRTASGMDPGRLAWSANALLPPDILVESIRGAPTAFHARYGAAWKLYRYRIWNAPVRPVWERATVWHVRSPLDLSAMRRAARFLVGRRDFRAFAGALGRFRGTVRTLRRLSIRRERRIVRLDFVGDGFLHNMVRSIVGTLVDVGKGKIRPEAVRRILASRDRRRAGPTAPPQGLCLVRVLY